MDQYNRYKVNKEIIAARTKHHFDIHYKDMVCSTNDVLKEMALNGAPEYTVLIADAQTAGKGRKGKPFYSPECGGVYMSILLKPVFPPKDIVKITPLAAVAVAEGIEDYFHKKTSIKWVNDVLIDGKKVCGILTEASFSSVQEYFEYVIVGIGINIISTEEGFPDDIKCIAGTISTDHAEDIDRNLFISSILNRFYTYYKELPRDLFYRAYYDRSSYIGEEILIISPKGTERAVALDLTEDFHLVVRDHNNEIKILNSGEISIRP